LNVTLLTQLEFKKISEGFASVTVYLILAAALVVALAVWYLLRRIASDRISKLNVDISRLKTNIRKSEECYQEVLRRELANIIQDQSLEDFEKAFEKMCRFEDEIEVSTEERVKDELQFFIKKYKFVREFDSIGTPHFVRYERQRNIADYVDQYCEISRFLILNRDRSRGRLYDNREIELFRRNVREQKNKQFKDRLTEAMVRYHLHMKTTGDWLSEFYEDADYSVELSDRRYSPADEYKIVCKTTGEHGIYSYSYDDERHESFSSYFRTNSAFSENADELI